MEGARKRPARSLSSPFIPVIVVVDVVRKCPTLTDVWMCMRAAASHARHPPAIMRTVKPRRRGWKRNRESHSSGGGEERGQKAAYIRGKDHDDYLSTATERRQRILDSLSLSRLSISFRSGEKAVERRDRRTLLGERERGTFFSAWIAGTNRRGKIKNPSVRSLSVACRLAAGRIIRHRIISSPHFYPLWKTIPRVWIEKFIYIVVFVRVLSIILVFPVWSTDDNNKGSTL